MSSSVDSAKIAKAQVFSSSLRDSLLMNLVSEWKMDDGSGSTIKDSWKGSDGTLTGTYTWISSNCIKNNCLQFDGSTAYATVNNNTLLNIYGPITIEAWVNPAAITAQYDIVCKSYQTSYVGYEFAIAGNALRFRVNPTSSTVAYRDSPTANFSLNKWQHVAVTFDGTNITFYKDGASLGVVAANGTLYSSSSNLIIGSYYNPGSFFNGIMNSLRIYNASVPASAIKSNYFSGLNNLLITGMINQKEYQDKLSKYDQ